tara:strand:- start:1620 stop:2780 length:1161 start_codon:yes stop_codon:yes gene_type:complete
MSILASGSLYYSSYSNPFLLLYFSICMGALLLLKKFNLSKYYFLYALISICFLLLHPLLLGNLDIPNIYFGYSIRIACFLIVISILGHQKFSLTYLRVILFICFFNLILYISNVYLFQYSQSLPSLLPDLRSWDDFTFKNYIFYFAPIGIDGNPVVSYSSFIRNTGLFWEGGAYQYFLNLALILSLYVKKNPIFSFPNWVLVISILTTFSTTGYLIMAVVLASIVMGKSSRRMFFVKTVIMIPLILSVLFSPVIFNKLFNTDSREYLGSTQRRILDTVVDYNVFRDYPFLGIGLGNQEIWESYSAQLSGGTSSSNGLSNYLAKIGLLGFLITLYPFMWFRFKNKMNQMILLCNILSILAQNIMLTPIFLLSLSLLNQKRSSKPLLP